MDSRQARNNANMTQAELAEALGVTRQTVCDHENGKTKSKKMMNKVNEYFGVEEEELPKFTEVEMRRVYADLKTAMAFVKDAMDKVGLGI